jgi:FKBP-type peptidyl-prolyl cis-trans isomerase SlyD
VKKPSASNGRSGKRPQGFQLGPGVWTRIGYRTFDADGEPVEGAEGESGVVFGYGALLPPIEAALAGLSVGAKRTVELTARDAYGERNPELELEVARDEFPPDVAPGDRYELERDDGSDVVARILAVSDDVVVVDMNHPLAGQRVRFEIEVLEARAATPEELQIAETQLLSEADEAPDPTEGLIPLAGLLRRGGKS